MTMSDAHARAARRRAPPTRGNFSHIATHMPTCLAIFYDTPETALDLLYATLSSCTLYPKRGT